MPGYGAPPDDGSRPGVRRNSHHFIIPGGRTATLTLSAAHAIISLPRGGGGLGWGRRRLSSTRSSPERTTPTPALPTWGREIVCPFGVETGWVGWACFPLFQGVMWAARNLDRYPRGDPCRLLRRRKSCWSMT